MGKKMKSERRSVLISVRMTAGELNLVKTVARLNGAKSLSAFARDELMAEATRRAPRHLRPAGKRQVV